MSRGPELRPDAHRGHAIVWLYADTGQPVRDNPDRPCGHCGLPNRADGHDACIGELPGVRAACCGHGNDNEATVDFDDDSKLIGPRALEYMRKERGDE